MYFVYLLRSEINPEKTYIGFTHDLERRLKDHNEGGSRYTNMFKPWKVETYVCFRSQEKAKEFELYLKTGSGGAFLRRHF